MGKEREKERKLLYIPRGRVAPHKHRNNVPPMLRGHTNGGES